MRRVAPWALAFALLAPPLAAADPSPSGPIAKAEAALRKSDYAAVERELAGARGADASRAAVLRAEAALEQGRYADAESLAKSAGPADRVAADVVLARASAEQGKVARALELLRPHATAKGADGRRARLSLAETLIRAGRRGDAEAPLRSIVDEYNDDTIQSGDAEGLAQVGRAAQLLRKAKDANQAFNESERVAKGRLETLLFRAELFLDKYDPGHAEEVLREALAIAPKRADTLVLLARVKLEQTMDFGKASELLDQALAIHPKHTGAFAVRAGLFLRDLDVKRAEAEIAKGLAIDPKHLELLTLRATARFLDDDMAGFEAGKRAVLAENKEYASFFTTAAELLEWEHRYDDIVRLAKEAVRIDPDDGKAWAVLGLTQLRARDEKGGLESLRRAWDRDHFNVRVFNTLNLYEKTIAQSYESASSGVFEIRYPKEERAVLERYVPRMLDRAWASMKARYGFVPKHPVSLELYGSREQFSVRTSGLPNIGIQGVCFGEVVAAMSPASEPFNWGNVVWHELGHVFAIQRSKNHVPRWFTEGLSEYETIALRPEWKRELDPQLYRALVEKRLPAAVDMNQAFTHAKNPEDVTVAYYAASQMLVFTVEAFGMKAIDHALRLWGEGKKTPEVLQTAFGTSAADYDRRYREWQLAQLSRYERQFLFFPRTISVEEAEAAVKAKPEDAEAHAWLGYARVREKKVDEGRKSLERAIALDPAQGVARTVLAKLAAAEKDLASAEKHLLVLRRGGHDSFQIEELLAEVAEAKKDGKARRFALEAARRLDPSQPDAIKGLLEMALAEKREDDALALMRELTQLEQHDGRLWHALLSRLVAKKAWVEAASVGEGAVYVDVHSARIHALYGEALSALGRHREAAFELRSATLCDAKPGEKAAHHARLAKELRAMGDSAGAKAAEAEAKRLEAEPTGEREPAHP